jgi:cytochrome c553
MSKQRTTRVAILVLSALSLPAFSDSARTSAPKSGDGGGAYSAAQAARGKIAVESSCAICHQQTLQGRVGFEDEKPRFDDLPRSFQKFIGNGLVPALASEDYMKKWKDKTVVQLAENLGGAAKSFPTAGMDEKTYLELAAYVLQMNGAPAGDEDLTALSTMTVGAALGTQKLATR